MDMSPFISPDPATRQPALSACLAGSRRGWSPERKLRFLERLAQCGNVRAACGAVGMTREAAYVLRRRDALFAHGWAVALVLARECTAEALGDRALDGIEEAVWYRGEQVGTRRRYDSRLLLAHLARLDRLVEEAPEAARDAGRFDELLGRIAGVEVPAEFAVEDETLPLDRETALMMAQDQAREAVETSWEERIADAPGRRLSDDEHEVYLEELHGAPARARTEAGAHWDAWFERACRAVDAALSGARTVSDVSGSAGGSP